MGYFDLNIPYQESDRRAADKSSLKSCRLRMAIKAMELGYTGIAYNRNFRGVMSESERCSTDLFPFSSLLKLVPSYSALPAAVKFHRNLLSVPVSSPFRQYTRLTVIADNPSQVAALNAGNPVLKSYDITAVRPLNQHAFDQACQTCEVDMIAIDFSEKLPFRLKQPMVKAAIKRGVYFEITYSGLIGDALTRRLVISNAKLLVDWTRGKNLILASAASSAIELRGPQDVSNLLYLLGLSMEHAKAAISKNCRSLIANALRKKQFYKEAVKVEKIPLDGQINPENFAFDEWLKWDPISSGEGDLLLDDMEKSFSMSKTPEKTINFTAAKNGLPVHGLQIKDLILSTKPVPEQPDTSRQLPDAMETVEISVCDIMPEEQNGLHPLSEKEYIQSDIQGVSNSLLTKDSGPIGPIPSPECQNISHVCEDVCVASACQESSVLLDSPLQDIVCSIALQKKDQTSLAAEKIVYQAPTYEDSETMLIDTDTSDIFSKCEETIFSCNQKLLFLNGLENNAFAGGTLLQDKQSQISGENILADGIHTHITTIQTENIPVSENDESIEHLHGSSSFSTLALEESNVENCCDVSANALESDSLDQELSKVDTENQRDPSLPSFDASSQDICVEEDQCKEMEKIHVNLVDRLHFDESCHATANLRKVVSKNVIHDGKRIDNMTGRETLGKPLSGERRKRKFPHQPFLFPFNHFLNSCHVKRKARKLKP